MCQLVFCLREKLLNALPSLNMAPTQSSFLVLVFLGVAADAVGGVRKAKAPSDCLDPQILAQLEEEKKCTRTNEKTTMTQSGKVEATYSMDSRGTKKVFTSQVVPTATTAGPSASPMCSGTLLSRSTIWSASTRRN